MPQAPRKDRAPARGTSTREAILNHATQVASVAGLDGLSIGGLAADLRMSKSGLFAHFGSKEELQLATVAAAREVFVADVVESARPTARGLARLLALCAGYLRYSEDRVFPAGCFFFGATAELSGRTGAVADEATTQMRGWLSLLADNVAAAIDAGELDRATEAEALAFELSAFLTAANWMAAALDLPSAYADARRAIARSLASRGASRTALRLLSET
jgi:AcrR family transcriptional regulator